MRLMFTTALASAVMFAAPAIAAGDKMHSTTGITAPERSAAKLPGASADSGLLRQHFESAGFSEWQPADNAEIFRMQSGDGQPVWVILMPENVEVGSAQSGQSDISGQVNQMAESRGSALDRQDASGTTQRADSGDMPQRGERADVSETFQGAGEQPDVAEAPETPEERPDVAEAELPEAGDLPRVPETEGTAEGRGLTGQTQPEGFAAQIPGELRSGLEEAGFEQVHSVDGADLFHAKTDDGRQAFIIVGELASAGSGLDQQQAPELNQQQVPGLNQQQPGAAPTIPDITPGNVPETNNGAQQR